MLNFLFFELTDESAPNEGHKPENNKHYTHWRHNECQPSSYHQKPDSGCHWIHGLPPFRVRSFLGLMCFLPHHSGSGFSEFLLGFGVCSSDQAACFTREPFYLFFSFVLLRSHRTVNSLSYIAGNVNQNPGGWRVRSWTM